ncbi:hypothetical protein IW261DRAFT_853820 [Armillaria novae-zelandiae]|uniref:Uncharacterized protein n=1 Tax=Armillaria novae-zelandiae TaxID=153914 RepID=A0AA39PK84_9AGAR|nr:hypothetical protein IW261DRAFT_853820 [Armillaria novae-zelandiae]
MAGAIILTGVDINKPYHGSRSYINPSVVMEQRPHVLYTKLLIRKGHGYPFWYPEPDSSRPAAYTERGVRPGDVGILNDIGGFDHLFNIFSDADDPINNGNVPPDFHPLRPSNSEPLRVIPACYDYNITSAEVDYKEFSAGISADATGLAGAEASFEFTTSKESAAVLCLPNSATKHEILNKAVIKAYATANGAAWYNYVNSPEYLGREAPNGSLYVVTGCDKTDSWGTAAVSKPSRSRSVQLRFMAAGVAGGDIGASHMWSSGFSADTRVYPLPSTSYPYPVDRENQCIFARGFTLSLADGLFKSNGKTVLKDISGSLKDQISSFDNRACPQLPGKSASSGRFSFRSLLRSCISRGSPSARDSEDDVSSSVDWMSDTVLNCEASISEFPSRDSELVNPSAAMNSYLLAKDPSLSIVVTHDEEWMDIMQEFGVDEDTTDESLWLRIREELDKRPLSSTTVNVTLDQDSDYRLNDLMVSGLNDVKHV